MADPTGMFSTILCTTVMMSRAPTPPETVEVGALDTLRADELAMRELAERSDARELATRDTEASELSSIEDGRVTVDDLPNDEEPPVTGKMGAVLERSCTTELASDDGALGLNREESTGFRSDD